MKQPPKDRVEAPCGPFVARVPKTVPQPDAKPAEQAPPTKDVSDDG